VQTCRRRIQKVGEVRENHPSNSSSVSSQHCLQNAQEEDTNYRAEQLEKKEQHQKLHLPNGKKIEEDTHKTAGKKDISIYKDSRKGLARADWKTY